MLLYAVARRRVSFHSGWPPPNRKTVNTFYMRLKVKWIALAVAVFATLTVAHYWAAQPHIKDLTECDVVVVMPDPWHIAAFSIKPPHNYTAKVYVNGKQLWPCNCTEGQASTVAVYWLPATIRIEMDSTAVCLSKQESFFTTEDCKMGQLICINDRGVFLIGERAYRIG